MSVILDALHKERNGGTAEGGAQSRATEAPSKARGPVIVRDTSPRETNAPARPLPQSNSVLGVVTVMAMLILLLVVAGLFFLIWRMQPNLLQPSNTEQSPGGISRPEPVALELPPPVPLQQTVTAPGTLPLPPPPVAAVLPSGNSMVTDAAPTNPDAAPKPVAPLKLGSIVCEAGDCLAHINGKTVRTGDTLQGGYKISEITPTAVTIEKPGAEPIVLSLI